MTILVTGGLGFIGSHTVVDLIEQGNSCIIIDNLSKSTIDVVARIEEVVQKKITFIQVEMLEQKALRDVFTTYNISSVIHFAGYKSVSESIKKPLLYYQNNLISTLNLLEVMNEFNVKKLVFSSSATVYGDFNQPPMKETYTLQAPNPYGRTKLILEEILCDFATTNNDWSIALMRYFNPIGAHKSGLLGELPFGVPNNLMPHVLKAASSETNKLQVFGGDYDTEDGSCIRDFIHIMDLANGHVKALNYIEKNLGCEAFNLGTGIGYSVLNLIHTFEKVTGEKIPYEIVDRREGDIVVSVADVKKAETILEWKAKYRLEDMCKDSWRWYQAIKEYTV
ncbi:UDP-glucose 4-epimerase GalE [Lysinibacillus macroides]|uniref:UDP-glucose 4-epimerase n=1 Tax=Lysinibacillus macroides TaxID=33935 RepID=A0A0M9DLI4_9BACI|nr:UDP-glucose 4-epimerase GalE [Lysinibacillus macroides]KOY83878.1 UDP-galactose-4-epimerase [Lysinibacillus macroides]QPR66644.1 UDP-glucose 4-epimerase GalE [Lysinibacillus macroides]